MIELLGFAVGFLVGLTGIGGGALMTPSLILLGVQVEKAVGTDLLYAFVVKSFSSTLYRRGKSIDYDLVKITAIPGLVGVTMGYFVLKRNFLTSDYLTLILGFSLLLAATLMIVSSLRDRFKTECFVCEKYCESFKNSNGSRVVIVLVALGVGVLVELTSIGSGTLMTFAVLTITKLKPNKVVGSELVTSLILTGFAATLHAEIGNIDKALALSLIPAGVLGSLAGFLVSRKCSPEVLKSAISFSIALAALTVILGKL